MPLADLLIPEFDMECVTTRTVLERVPDDRIEWKPHEKSFPMGHLAQLVAMIPGWTSFVLTKNEFDIAPTDKKPGSAYSFQKVSALLELFDKNVAEARPLIAGVSDATLDEPWTLKAAGNAVSTMSRYMVMRTLVINPTADEKGPAKS